MNFSPTNLNRPHYALRLEFSLNKKQQRWTTGVSVPSELWDNKKKTIKRPTLAQQEKLAVTISQLNKKWARLEDLKAKAVQFIAEEEMQPHFDVEKVKQRWCNYRDNEEGDQPRIRRGKNDVLTDLISNCIKEKATKAQSTTEGQKPITKATINNFNQLLAAVRAFDEYRKKETLSAEVTMDWYFDFVAFHRDVQQLKPGTIGKYIRNLKTALNWAISKGIRLHTAVLSKAFAEPKAERLPLPTLNDEEISRLASLPLSGREERARDLFVISCRTGMRASDIERLQDIIPVEKEGARPFLYFTPEKSRSAPVEVNLHDEVLAIRERWNGWPPMMHTQKVNDLIKPLCRDIGLTDKMLGDVQKTVQIQGKPQLRDVRKMYPRWKLITMHSGRQSFVTWMAEATGELSTVMAMSGHKKQQTVQLYLNRQQGRLAKKTSHLFAKSKPENDE